MPRIRISSKSREQLQVAKSARRSPPDSPANPRSCISSLPAPGGGRGPDRRFQPARAALQRRQLLPCRRTSSSKRRSGFGRGPDRFGRPCSTATKSSVCAQRPAVICPRIRGAVSLAHSRRAFPRATGQWLAVSPPPSSTVSPGYAGRTAPRSKAATLSGARSGLVFSPARDVPERPRSAAPSPGSCPADLWHI